jgi:DNA polymerase-3 subunit gamma/tau
MTVALYRRFRPLRFADLIGQGVVAETLRNEVRSGTLAHAYLFAGTRGTGKTSTARILARAVNCESPQDGEPDNTCRACREILEGTSVDVLEIDAASNRGIDEMRDLREKVKYLPASLRQKVYVIDEAHMLTTEAWNAFLKTLEEPPGHVLFVLATTEPHKVPETVRSRVQRFDFRRVASADIGAHLAAVAAKDGVEVTPEALQLIARASLGSVRDALSFLDQALATGARPVDELTARGALGLADPTTLQEIVRSLAGADAAAVLRASDAAFAAGADPRQLLRELSRLARSAELCALGYPEGAEGSPEELALCREVAAIAPSGFWVSALDLFATAETNLRQVVDARLQVELALLRLVRPPASAAGDALAALEARVAALEANRADSGPASASHSPRPPSQARPQPDSTSSQDRTQPSATTPAPPAASFEAVADWAEAWPLLVEAVNRSYVPLAGVLRDCSPVEADHDRLVIGARSQFHYDRIRDPKQAPLLAEAASAVAGRAIAVETSFAGAPRDEAAGSERPGAVSDVTQAVLDTFKGSRVTATRLRDPSATAGPSRGNEP